MGGILKVLASNHSMADIIYDGVLIRDSDFSKGNLAHCSFGHSAYFRSTNFTSAQLEDCVIESTFLDCDFRFSTWETVDASDSVFEDCLFFNVSFRNCNLSRAHFRGCVFFGCSFVACDISKTRFSSSSSVVDSTFVGCDFDQIRLPDLFIPLSLTYCENIPYIPMVCPDEGPFLGYKKAWSIDHGSNYPVLITLLIPEDARRTSGFGRKCRCDKATVVKMEWLSPEGHSRPTVSRARSAFDKHFVYTEGKKVEPRNGFCTDRWDACSAGIHFFMNKQEAIDY